jgi:hypothetical protein
MVIQDIYEKYKIMPALQLHQLKVTAVATMICDNSNKQIDKESILTACLFHDMGNIIKFDLFRFPEFNQPKGLEYWSKVQKNFIKKYGTDEHSASVKIAEELNQPEKIKDIINSIIFDNVSINYESGDFDTQISAYSDMRVMPLGVTSLKERLSDLKERYSKRMDKKRRDNFDKNAETFIKLEKQIFKDCKIRPENITEDSIKPLVEELRQFDIITTE